MSRVHLLDGPETPQEMIRTGLMVLDALQRLLVDDPRMTPVLLDERLRLVATIRNRLWEAVTVLERPTP